MIVNVTQSDIDSGNPHCPSSCPVSLAVERTTRRLVSVSTHEVYFMGTGGKEVAFLPEEVSAFISDFDAERKVSPFSFELETNRV